MTPGAEDLFFARLLLKSFRLQDLRLPPHPPALPSEREEVPALLLPPGDVVQSPRPAETREEKQGEKEELFPSTGWEESRKQEVEVKMSNPAPVPPPKAGCARDTAIASGFWSSPLVTETTFASGPQCGGDSRGHLPTSAGGFGSAHTMAWPSPLAPGAQPVPELSGKT